MPYQFDDEALVTVKLSTRGAAIRPALAHLFASRAWPFWRLEVDGFDVVATGRVRCDDDPRLVEAGLRQAWEAACAAAGIESEAAHRARVEATRSTVGADGTSRVTLNITATPLPEPPLLRCSFCDKSQREVQKLVAGHRDALICDECVGLCNEIIAKDDAERTAPTT